MARKSGGPNRSEAIRTYSAKNTSAKPKDIADALAEQGVKVSPGYVSTVLSNARRKGGKGKRGKKRGAPGATKGYANLVQAKKLSDAMGGIDKARAALNALAKILDA